MKHTKNDVLRMAGHLLLAHPTTGELAKDKDGKVVGPNDRYACSWCFMGALHAVTNVLKGSYSTVFSDAAAVTGVTHYRDWDSGTDAARRRIATNLTKITEP